MAHHSQRRQMKQTHKKPEDLCHEVEQYICGQASCIGPTEPYQNRNVSLLNNTPKSTRWCGQTKEGDASLGPQSTSKGGSSTT
ncbi:hypothetical protein CHS0354_022009, partial [Potamilus streckersoni]